MKRFAILAVAAIVAAGCAKAPTPQAPAKTEHIAITRDGEALRSTARLLNSTLYLPLAAMSETEEQLPVKGGLIQLGPGTGFDIPGSRFYMRAGDEPIVPKLVEESGVVWAPASYFRAAGWRLQHDAPAGTVTMTRAEPHQRPFPEEIPEQVKAVLASSGPAPRVSIVRPETGLTFVTVATAGTGISLIAPAAPGTYEATRVFVAKPGEQGATDRVVRMLSSTHFGVSIPIWVGRDGQANAWFSVGEFAQDLTRYEMERREQSSPPVRRATPTDVVRHYSSMLGAEREEIGAEEIKGDQASVAITKQGQTFYAHLVKGPIGWKLVATTWAVPCQQADYCLSALSK